MISQSQVNRMWFQVNPCAEVWLVVFSDIAIDQCDRNDKGNQALTILHNDIKPFG